MYTTQQEAKHVISYLSARHVALWYQELLQVLRRFFASALICIITVLLLYSLWPLVPYFICDWALDIVIWHTALLLACKPFKLLPLRRAQRIRRPQVVMRHVRQDVIP